MIGVLITAIIATALMGIVIIIGLAENSAWIFDTDYWKNRKYLAEISKRISEIEEKLKEKENDSKRTD